MKIFSGRMTVLVPQQKSKGLKIFLWFTFSVAFALFPILVNYINGRVYGKAPGWLELLGGGELLLIAAVLAADAVGRVFLGGDRKQGLRVACGAGCTLLLIVTSVYFGKIAFSIDDQRTELRNALARNDLNLAIKNLNPKLDAKTSASDSLWLFGFTVAAALGVILVEED
jgi:hypothetical protein